MKIGIDLGSKNITVYSEAKGIVLNFPCVVAMDTSAEKIITVGSDAQKMIGRNPASMRIIRPFADGSVADFESAEILIRYVIKSTCKNAVVRPKVAVSKPCVTSGIELAMLRKVTENAGARQVLVVDNALAALVGAGVDINKPEGNLIVDIGGGTTDIAVVTMGQIAKAKTVKIAGNRFDSAIQSYIKHKYSVIIGELTAEEAKKSIGGVLPRKNELAFVVKGQSIQTGFPVNVEITSTELCPILSAIADEIAFEIRQLLETVSPQLTADIFNNGLVLSGGCSNIFGLDTYMQQALKIHVKVASGASECVARGMEYFLKNYEKIFNSDYKYDENGALSFS